jgi:CubicO group peptidase (beta-lactamase class C family)
MKTIIRLSLVILLSIQHMHAFAASPEVTSLDAKLKSLIPTNEPGCSVGVFENGNTLVKEGYGLANAEFNPLAHW